MSNIYVSVIVPVYNVESYLKKCLDSLINQTYQDYEVLLVDDGSTDSSGKMCDAYAEKYTQLRVFHKANSGVSDARNYALPYIKGAYVAYVDADDYVERDYLHDMVDLASENMADIVISSYIRETSEGVLLKNRTYTGLEEHLTPEQALKEMCYETRIGTSSFAKLISAKLVEKFPFPSAIAFGEDLATIYKMIGASSQILFLDKPLYHYIYRPGSAYNNGWNHSVMGVMEATICLLGYIYNNYPNIYAAAVHRYFLSANEVYVRAFCVANYKELIAPIQSSLREYWKVLWKNSQISLLKKIKYGLMTFAPSWYRVLRMILRK